jgi:predicted metal-binding membrane protein
VISADRQVPARRQPLEPVRDRATVVTSVILLLIAAAAWLDVLRSSLGAPDMMMTMFMPVTVSDGLAFLASWGIMMTAMMLPSALPMIGLYGAVQRGRAPAGPRGVPVAVFTLAYLAVWAVSGAPGYLAHTLFMALSPPAFAYGIALILLAAGGFQFSPLKRACLQACRSPLGFLLSHWRPGLRGSLALGWSHAVYCLGCCWALMVVLVAAGAMGLAWVLLIAAVVSAEKLLPAGERIARATGVALVLLGVAVVLRPDLVAVLRGGHAM